MGQSSLERFYAFVETKEGDLGEQLVRNGLARSYGFKTAPPGLKSSRMEVERLQQFEDEAKREKIGAWGVDAGRLDAHAQTRSAFRSFVADGKTRSSSMPRGSPVDFPVDKPAASIAPNSPVPQTKSNAKDKTPLGRIDVNTATEKELTTVPGIGHVMAGRIIAARHFRSADDLKRVSGIGEKKYAQIRPFFQ